jgi:hypothetical protein
MNPMKSTAPTRMSESSNCRFTAMISDELERAAGRSVKDGMGFENVVTEDAK